MDIDAYIRENISSFIDVTATNVMYTSLAFYHSDSVNMLLNGIIATPPKNELFLELIDYIIDLVRKKQPFDFLHFTNDFGNRVAARVKEKLHTGMNYNVNDTDINYYLFQ